MNDSMLLELFAQLPQDKKLQALQAQGISIAPSLMNCYDTDDAILKSMDASRLEPWNELRIPMKGEERPGIFDRNKVIQVDKTKAIREIPDYGFQDPMLSNFEMDSNSQGGF